MSSDKGNLQRNFQLVYHRLLYLL